MQENPSAMIKEYEDIYNPASVNFNRLLTYTSRLEVIREEESNDGSDSEHSHVLSARDRTINNLLDEENRRESSTVAHVTTKFNPAHVLRAFIRHRRRRKQQHGIPPQGTAIRFQQNEHQVPTTCVLVDTRESDMAPAEYRSICITETVNTKIMQAEVINIGSNSSSLDDLSDIDLTNCETTLENTEQIELNAPGFIDRTGFEEASGLPISEPNDCMQNHTFSENQCSSLRDFKNNEDSATHAPSSNFGPNQIHRHDDDIANDGTLNSGVRNDLREYIDAERTHYNAHNTLRNEMSEHRYTLESGTADSTVAAKNWSTLGVSSSSVVVVDCDRESAVVGNNHNVITALKDSPFSVNVRDRASKSGIDSMVIHCVRDEEIPALIEKNMHPPETNTVVQKENQTAALTPAPTPTPPIPAPRVVPKTAIPLPQPLVNGNENVTNLGQHLTDSAEIDKSDTPPLLELVPLTVEALSSSTTGSSATAKNAQANSRDHPSKSDHADANQASAENCVDAVTSCDDKDSQKGFSYDQSVLYKFIQEQKSTVCSTRDLHHGKLEKLCQVSPVFQLKSDRFVADLKQNQADHESNSDREPKIEQSDADHGGQNSCTSYEETIVRQPENTYNNSYETITTGSRTGISNVSVTQQNSTYLDESKHNLKSAESLDTAKDSPILKNHVPKNTDMQTEISFLKDAELQEEFRKLEIETARFERDLKQITVPSHGYDQVKFAKPSNKYFVSKQKDFAVERSNVANINNSMTMIDEIDRTANDAQCYPAARVEKPTSSEIPTEIKVIREDNPTGIKVNVAALIATHQEKQQQSAAPPATQTSKFASTHQKDCVEISNINSIPLDEASEPIVSVSDKCQQFEQHIRKNSNDNIFNTMGLRKIYTGPSIMDEMHQKPGTTNDIYGEACCDAMDNGSFSETDLLHEIDHALVLAKDFLFSRGVWSPFNRSTEVLTKEELDERSSSNIRSNPTHQPPIWTPRSAPPSPASERRKFRPIGYESPKPSRRILTPNLEEPSTVVAPPWNQPGYNPPLPASENSKPFLIQNSTSNTIIGSSVLTATSSTSPSPPSQGQSNQVRFPPQQRSTISQEPTINTLLKSKDGKTATIKESEASVGIKKGSTHTSSSLMTNTSRQSSVGVISPTTNLKPTEVGHKTEAVSSALQDNNYSQDQKMQQTTHKINGIGPITREGMPLTLRSEIDEANRDKWYKQMYQTLHKTQDDGYPYKSSGYQSEPEANYDSDNIVKYNTLDRRRTPIGLSSTSYNKFSTLQSKPTTTQQYYQQSVKSGQSAYKNQPGKIEDYIPGHSSISEKESKQQLEHKKLTTSKTYSEGNLSRALKEQGYESDSTLVFHKRAPSSSAALSPVEQKQYYKNMQAGGEVPLQGFRKPAPERPKDCNEEQIESDLLVEIKESINIDNTGQCSVSADSSNNPFRHRENIACYPIANINRPLDLFGPFPKEYRTFVPPVPPSRKSSRSNSTLKIVSQVKTNAINRQAILEQTTTSRTSSSVMKQPSKFRSKSAGPLFFGGATSNSSIVTSTSMMKEEKNQENSTRLASKRFTTTSYRSSSPAGQQRKSNQSPVAFGRGISKERTFAEEKKRIEEKLPKIVSVSTSILRNPELKSPNEVKKALRSSYLPIVGRLDNSETSSLKRYSSHGTYRSASSIYSSNKSINKISSPAVPPKKDENAMTSGSTKNGSAHQHQQNKSFNRKFGTKRSTTPSMVMKTSFQKASKAFGLKTKTSSNQSLARSCSTYSIDSTNSKSRRSRISDGTSNIIPPTRNHTKNPHKVFLGAGTLDHGSAIVIAKVPTSEIRKAHNHTIVQHKENMCTDDFFQKLFLRDHAGRLAEVDADGKPTSVLEKARMWNSLTCRSEPSLKQSNYYLSQIKPVSSSKFKTQDREDVSEFSTAYQIVRQIGGDVVEQVNRFESMIKLTDNQSDELHQFGYERGRRMEIDYSFHERSRSEPPAEKTTTTTTSSIIQEELVGTDRPRTIVGRRCHIAQRTSRSPSCRRIQYLKGKEGQVKKIIRTRSLSGTNGKRARLEKCKDELVRSHSLNLAQDTCVSRSRFRELNSFYNSLERLGQLERETSSSSNDLRPTRRMREEEIIDYDLWKRVRVQEKAERELNQLKNKLKQDQREKDLFFLPRDPEDVRWRSDLDTGLRNREKSVEDLKCVLNEQALSFEEAKRRDLENQKDHYKPLWRGSSVIDVASHLEEKYSTLGEKRDEPQSLDVISSNLLSTLSSEQMKKLKNQLSEIYSNSTPKNSAPQTKVTLEMQHHQEEYIINVPERANRLESLLKVRSHSVLTQDKINQSLCPKQSNTINNTRPSHDNTNKMANISSPKTFQSSSLKVVDRDVLSRSLCQELKNKIMEKHHTLPLIGKYKKNARPTILEPQEAIFRPNTYKKHDESAVKSTDHQANSKTCVKNGKKQEEVINSQCDTESISSETSSKTVIFRSQSLTQTADDVPVEDIKTKIQYFEKKHEDETPTVTIYHAREDSSPSEDESRSKEEDDKKIGAKGTSGSTITLSQSFTDLKDLFGEKRSVSCSAYTTTTTSCQQSKRSSVRNMSPKRFTLRSRSTTPDYATCIQTGEVKKIKDKFESLDVKIWWQSNDITAGSERHYQSDSELHRQPISEYEKRGNESNDKSKSKQTTGSTIVRHHESGDVSRITHKYEAQAERAQCRKSRKDRVISPIPKNPLRKDDRFMPHINVISKTASLKQEIKSRRASHQQHASSKAAALQTHQDTVAGTCNIPTGSARRSASSGSGEFQKLKSKFETREELSLLGKMYTSVPDIRELKEISGYLSGAWIAHQFPMPTDNARSLAAPNQLPPDRQIVRKESASSTDRLNRQHHAFRTLPHQPDSLHLHSSTAPRQSSKHHQSHNKNDGADFLKQFYTIDGDTFGDRKDTCELTRSKRRLEAEALWRKIQSMTGNSTAGTRGQLDKPSVTFEESPRRYIESDVNIHYKTPIRFEYKEPIPDDELAYRQADHMRRVYQEERRRKYIHELEDMNSRRHMDNILPSQKSPIPLNRYDDFAADLSPKPQIVRQPKTIARALYDFQGQSIRGNVNVKQPLPKKPTREGKARAKFNFTAQTAVELSLLKGELVTLTRRVDSNWFEGKIGNKKGIFPVSYVEILTDIDGEESYDIERVVSRPQSALGIANQSSHALTTHFDNSHTNGRISPGIVRETKTIQKTEVLHVDTTNEPISYRALYNYKPQNTDELELVEGDVVYVLEKCDDGWFVGTSARTGCFGTFPGNYVTKM
uniref:Uncharacterized protein n=1 Tax=Anopheles epiroticus TaxID=199890 RepID=A0A182P4G7_9DIPT